MCVYGNAQIASRSATAAKTRGVELQAVNADSTANGILFIPTRLSPAPPPLPRLPSPASLMTFSVLPTLVLRLALSVWIFI